MADIPPLAWQAENVNFQKQDQHQVANLPVVVEENVTRGINFRVWHIPHAIDFILVFGVGLIMFRIFLCICICDLIGIVVLTFLLVIIWSNGGDPMLNYKFYRSFCIPMNRLNTEQWLERGWAGSDSTTLVPRSEENVVSPSCFTQEINRTRAMVIIIAPNTLCGWGSRHGKFSRFLAQYTHAKEYKSEYIDFENT